MFATPMCRYTAALVLLIAAGGCGSGEGLVPFRGAVTLDGRPLADATVQFIAQDAEGRNALGTTDADGVFHLSTAKPGDGALPGSYKVVVRRARPDTGSAPAVSPADAMAATAGPKPGRPPVGLPARYSQPGQTILVQDVPASADVVFELQSK